MVVIQLFRLILTFCNFSFKAGLWRYKFSQLKGSSDDGKSKIKFLFQNQDSKSIEAKVIHFDISLLHFSEKVIQQGFQINHATVQENELLTYDLSIDFIFFLLKGAGVFKPLRRASLYSRFFCCQSRLPGSDVCGEPRRCDYHWVSFSVQYLL